MNLEQRMVRDFHRRFDLPIGDDLLVAGMVPAQQRLVRASLIVEEAAEFAAAARENDTIEMADALADLLYVTYAAAVVLGIDIGEVFKEVHSSNMTKSPAKSKGGKVFKGGDYRKPEIMEVLKTQEEDIYQAGEHE